MCLVVLIACECSQTVCGEFRSLGDECYSCDVVDQYGGHPEWHIKCDVLDILHGGCSFRTMDGLQHTIDKWDLIIAHPPCTYLSRAQMNLYDRNRLGDERVDRRIAQRNKAIEFFMQFTETGVPTVIENPVGYMSTHYRKPDQVVEPYDFGDPATKKTCLWLFGLPKLQLGPIVDKPKVHHFPHSNSMGDWFYKTSCLPAKDRARERSKTFPGIARAIAKQYHRFLTLFV